MKRGWTDLVGTRGLGLDDIFEGIVVVVVVVDEIARGHGWVALRWMA